MSAGGLSYDCLTTSRKVTLPSVEMWGTNMNILRAPPASRYTRRIDKVGDTQEILLAQEDSGDRIAEMINVYARGVNPMVSVSYDNYSNNGGRTSILQANKPVKLPYKPEVFHPPVFRQEDLMPLSRQPRTWFYALANPEIPHIVQQMSCPETKSAVWNNAKMLHAEMPARLQYTNDAPLTDVYLPEHHKSLRHDVLLPDRLSTTHPQIEKNPVIGNINPKTIQDKVLFSHDSGTCLPSAKTHHQMIDAVDPKHIDHRKNVYSMFANKKGNPSASTLHDFLQKIQHRAIQEKNLPVQSVTVLPSRPDGDSRLFSSPTQPKAATHDILVGEVQTKPSRTMFWKPSETLGRDPILAPNAIHDSILHTEHIANQQFPSYEHTLSHDTLAHTPHRQLPTVFSETNRVGMYTSQEPSHTVLSDGNIVKDKRNTSVSSSQSIPSRSTDVNDFQNVPVSVRTDMLHPSAQSARGRDQASLQNIVYNDLVVSQANNTPNTPQTEAFTHKTSYDKTEWFGEKHLQPQRLATIQADTSRDTSAQGYDVYSVQDRDASSHVSHAPSAGSFDPRPTLPMTERVQMSESDFPIHDRAVQRDASHQYFQRFSDPYH